MRIEFIDQHREHIVTLAAWHHEQWGHLYDDWTLDAARTEIETHAHQRSLPTTLIAVEGGVALGSVSLVLEDAPELCEHGSPWLANLYVIPEARGQGIGTQLVRAAVELAAHSGVTQLFLFTPEHAGFYRRLGWRQIARTALKGTAVDLMEFSPLAIVAAA